MECLLHSLTRLLNSHTIQVKAFAKEWKEYVYTIELQSNHGPNAFGRHLDPAKVALVPFYRSEDEQRCVCMCAACQCACACGTTARAAVWARRGPAVLIARPAGAGRPRGRWVAGRRDRL